MMPVLIKRNVNTVQIKGVWGKVIAKFTYKKRALCMKIFLIHYYQTITQITQMIISILAKSSNYKPFFLVGGINHVNSRKENMKNINQLISMKCN